MKITQTKFTEDLKSLTQMITSYNNKYPYNIGYVYEDGSRSFDCWNMIKSLLNGYDITNNTPGYKCPTLSITGDVNGRGLLNKCTQCSQDFGKINQYPAGTYLFMAENHSGIYMGEHEIDGQFYNVIECTASWEKKVLWSWVDDDGTRRHYKGGRKNGTWTDFGLLTEWVDYDNVDETNSYPDAERKPSVPGYTLRRGMWNNTKVADLQRCLRFVGCAVGRDYGRIAVDGCFGPNTEFAVKEFQGRHRLVKDGIYGPKTYAEMLKSVGNR